MPTAREEAEEGRLRRVGRQVERGDVAVQVVHRNEREPARGGERLGRRQAHQQRADQPRPARDGDGLDLLELRLGLLERLGEHRSDQLEVPTRGDLGDDAAVACVQRGLRGNDVRADAPVSCDERDGRLVARGLDPQNHPNTGETMFPPWAPFLAVNAFSMPVGSFH